MIINILKVFFTRSYDEVFKLIMANIFWFLTSLFSCLLALPPATFALYKFVNAVMQREDPDFSQFWYYFKQDILKSYAAFVLNILLIGIPGLSMIFYMKMTSTLGILSYVHFPLCLWMLIFVLHIQLFFFPFLVHQKINCLLAMKRSALLLLMKPWISFIIFLNTVILYCCYSIVPAVFFLLPALIACLKTVSFFNSY